MLARTALQLSSEKRISIVLSSGSPMETVECGHPGSSLSSQPAKCSRRTTQLPARQRIFTAWEERFWSHATKSDCVTPSKTSQLGLSKTANECCRSENLTRLSSVICTYGKPRLQERGSLLPESGGRELMLSLTCGHKKRNFAACPTWKAACRPALSPKASFGTRYYVHRQQESLCFQVLLEAGCV